MRFLTARWRDLAMVSWPVDSGVLEPRVPPGTELDRWCGQPFVTLLGISFSETRVLRLPIPFHRTFADVNFRFYVTRPTAGGPRKGVVFIREIVPRRAVALLARRLYGEPFVALPVRGAVSEPGGPAAAGGRQVLYEWDADGRRNCLAVKEGGGLRRPARGSLEAFVLDRYWGYSRRPGGRTFEFGVEHPSWQARAAIATEVECDVAGLYGAEFVGALRQPPAAVFVAEGSAVTVRTGGLIG